MGSYAHFSADVGFTIGDLILQRSALSSKIININFQLHPADGFEPG
jgi:hypothetical protein